MIRSIFDLFLIHNKLLIYHAQLVDVRSSNNTSPRFEKGLPHCAIGSGLHLYKVKWAEILY